MAKIKVMLEGRLMHPSDYLAAVEFKGRDATLTIRSVKYEELVTEKGAKKVEPIIQFVETPKKFVCNKTNADSIARLYGNTAEEWVGKRVTLYPTRTQFGKQTVDCIRVREQVPPPKGVKSQDKAPGGDIDDVLNAANPNGPEPVK